MYGLIAVGAIGSTLIVAVLIGYAIRQRTKWDVRWGRYRDAQMKVAQQTLVDVVKTMDLYREIDHPLHGALMPVIERHNAELDKIKLSGRSPLYHA